MVIRYELEKLGLHCTLIELGRAETTEMLSAEQLDIIKIALLQSGLELMENKKSILIERIKNVIIEMIHFSDRQLKTNFSDYLSKKLGYDYTYLANLFSEQQGTTIEQFIIMHKIQRIKELMEHDELNLTEISWKLNYSSVAHLCTQFKKVTGITPSHFKQLERQNHIGFANV
jgi:AraC-like DNA-binding protein